MNPIKKVAAIHDLAGIGRVSLMGITPVLATMGIQVCPLPTGVFSTNTGYYDNFTFVDLTDTMASYMDHWAKIGLKFDAIYSGFLGSSKQVDLLIDFIKKFKTKNTICVVDPIMGDNNKLYPTISKELMLKMKELLSFANIITPNYTEASYLLDMPTKDSLTIAEIKEILVKLAKLGPNIVVITSVPSINNKDIHVYAYEKSTGYFWNVSSSYIPISYPGTGDIFTSVLIGKILNGDSLPVAINKAVQFIYSAIKKSYKYNYNNGEGILLEGSLSEINRPLIKNSYKQI